MHLYFEFMDWQARHRHERWAEEGLDPTSAWAKFDKIVDDAVRYALAFDVLVVSFWFLWYVFKVL